MEIVASVGGVLLFLVALWALHLQDRVKALEKCVAGVQRTQLLAGCLECEDCQERIVFARDGSANCGCDGMDADSLAIPDGWPLEQSALWDCRRYLDRIERSDEQ
jgi:hypothetical protein